MESTLCLRYGPLSTLPLHIPSLVRSARVTKPQFSFSHSSLSLSIPNRSSYRSLGHAFRSVVGANNRFPALSTNDESDNEIVRGTVGASLALASVLAIVSCGCTMNPKGIAGTPKNLQRSSSTKAARSTIYPKGGKAALKSLLDMTVYLASSLPMPAKMPSKPRQSKLLSGEDVEDLKVEAMSLMKSGHGDEAVKRLKKTYGDCEGSESLFKVGMALVEVLICLGKYEEALTSECLWKLSLPSDARVPLYKAIIYTMMDKKEDAKECWKDFISSIDGGLPTPAP